MTVQELYDYALKHGITGCLVRIHVLHDDEFIEFISEHLDLVTHQDDTEDIDGYIGLWVRRDKAENVWSAASYAEHAKWQKCINEYDINKYLNDLKVYCSGQDSCEICPIAYFEEKPEYWHCSLTDTPVFEWEDIANKLKDEHKVLSEHIKMIANHCRDDISNCEDCRYCRSYERCDLRLHIPADWVIYDDSTKRGKCCNECHDCGFISNVEFTICPNCSAKMKIVK